jgi:Insertion element 4 transposase N-terminal
VAQSAMSWVAPSPVGSDVAVGGGDGGAGLRVAVLAGPASGAGVADGLRVGLLAELAGGDALGEALTRAGHVDGRRRVLTGMVTVLAVLGLCLFRSEGYDSVLARVLALLPGVLAPGAAVPTGSALSQARTRLHGDALAMLFAATAGVGNDAGVAGACWLGLELTVFDGTVVDLAATPENMAQFAVPSGGRFPQARLVTLASCGTRRVRAAAVGLLRGR